MQIHYIGAEGVVASTTEGVRERGLGLPPKTVVIEELVDCGAMPPSGVASETASRGVR